MEMASDAKVGWDALNAFLFYLDNQFCDSKNLLGRARNAFANFQAFSSFIDSARQKRAKEIYEERIGAVNFMSIVFGSANDDLEYFGVGRFFVEASSVRIREVVPGVWIIADRWADDIRIALSPNAPFKVSIWQTDEWDMPKDAIDPVQDAKNRLTFLGK